MRYYTGDIQREPNTIFVFGSNTQGRHGAGAAKVAHDVFGAIYGQAKGLQGQSYAIVTKDLRKGYRSISKDKIISQIKDLYEFAREHPELNFKVAYRNTFSSSLNGYTGFEMIGMFIDAGPIPDNIWFSEEWRKAKIFMDI